MTARDSNPPPVWDVGVISDTHGLVRPSALEALRGVDLILHAGDIGGKDVVRALEDIAPVYLVRGNTDQEAWSRTLPDGCVAEVGDHRLYMLHDLGTLSLDPASAGLSVVVFGHSHMPQQYRKKGVLYFNPGSAGPRRFRLPVSVGRLVVRGDQVEGTLVTLPS
ncbi:MAG: metallophosphoesterase family protein [Myxococcota bacterium]